MRIHLAVHLENHMQRLFSVTMDVQAHPGNHEFTLHALTAGNGISVEAWLVKGGACHVQGSQIHIQGSSFSISYSLEILHKDCLGSGIDMELTYPFLNENEIFFGSGILPVPKESCTVVFQLLGLPDGWCEFSSLTPGGMHPDKLPEFFCYCTAGLTPFTHVYHGLVQDVTFRLAVQKGKSLPMPVQALFAFIDSYLKWLENSLAPYQRADEINFLVLQAPQDFSALANRRTFATGENVLNGIACYAPHDLEYLKCFFDYTSYSQYLYEGLAHELLHFYTTASSNGRERSVLYPSPQCPDYAVKILADALNIYFYSQYVSEHIPEARGSFDKWVGRSRLRQQKTGKRQALLDLQVLDGHLLANGSTLLALFREMVLLKLQDRRPYESSQFLFDTMRTNLHISSMKALEDAVLLQE